MIVGKWMGGWFSVLVEGWRFLAVNGNGFAVAVLKSFSKGMPISAPPIPKRMNFGMNPVEIGRDKGPPVFPIYDTVLPAPLFPH